MKLLSTYRYIILIGIFCCTFLVNTKGQPKHAAQPIDENAELYQTKFYDAIAAKDYAEAVLNARKLQEAVGSFTMMDSINSLNKAIDTLALKAGDMDNHIDAKLSVLYTNLTKLRGDPKLDEDMQYLSSYIHSEEISNWLRADIAYVYGCYMYDNYADVDSCIILLKDAIALSDVQKKKPYTQLHYRLEMSRKLEHNGNYVEAIDYLIEAEELAKSRETKPIRYIQIYESFALIMMALNDFEKAEDYYLKSLETAKKANYKNTKYNTFYGLASCYLQLGDITKSRDYIMKSLPHYRKNERSAMRAYTLIADGYILEGKLDMAKTYLDSAQISLNSSEVKFGKEDFPYTSAKYNYYEQNHSTALDIVDSELLTEGTRHLENGNLHFLKYKILKSQEKYEEAIKALEKAVQLQDSTKNRNNFIRVQRIESEYNRKEQDNKISSLNEVTIAQDKALAVRNTALTLGSIMLLILGGLLFSLYKLFSKNQKNQTKLAAQNKTISKALSENQILIKEIHHRVKNNLQVISSLLSMQARKVTDKDTKDALNSSKTRVQSMSILHQNLYQGENLKDVEVDEYIDKLIENIIDTYHIQDNIKFHVEIDPIALDVDTLVPLGLVANELICNALKYAFEDRENGNLTISLLEQDGKVTLRVADDGVGFEGDELPIKEGSLGTKLINSFTRRLEGKIKIDKSNGTDISIIFDKDNLTPKP